MTATAARAVVRAALAVVIVSGLVVVPSDTSAAAPVASTFATMINERDTVAVEEQARIFRPEDSTFTISGGSQQVRIEVDARSGPHAVSTYVFDAPGSADLRPGLYENAVHYAANGSGPGMGVTASPWGCNELTGRFRILHIHVSDAGVVDSFDATYQQRCGTGTDFVYGQVRYNAGATHPDLLVAGSEVDFPPRAVGDGSRSTPVWLINTGAEPVTLGAASIVGDTTSSFSRFHDACSGTTIPPAGQCILYLRFAPKSEGTLTAALQLPASTAADVHTVALVGVGGVTATEEPGTRITDVEHILQDSVLVTFSAAIQCPGPPGPSEYPTHYRSVDDTDEGYDPQVVEPSDWECPTETQLLLHYPAGTIRQGEDGWLNHVRTSWLLDGEGNEIPADLGNLIDLTGSPPAGTLIYASTGEGRIVTFDSADARHPLTSVRLQLNTGERVVVDQIDFRARDGLLYGRRTPGGQLVTIDESGLVTPVADGQPVISRWFDMRGDDDALLTDQGTSIEYGSPDTGQVLEMSSSTRYEDASAGSAEPRALASTWPDNDPATTGRLYAHDQFRGQLIEVVGTRTQPLVKPMGNLPGIRVVGLDIGLNGDAWMAFGKRAGGPTRFAQVDLETGTISGSDMLVGASIGDIALPLPRPSEDLDPPAIRSTAFAGVDAGNDVVDVVFDEPITCASEGPAAFTLQVRAYWTGTIWADEQAVEADCSNGSRGLVRVTFPGELFFVPDDLVYTLRYAAGTLNPVTDSSGHAAVPMSTRVKEVGGRLREPFIDVQDATLIEGQPGHVEVRLSHGAWAGTNLWVGNDNSQNMPPYAERGDWRISIPEGDTVGRIPVTIKDDRLVEPTGTTLGWVDGESWYGTRRRNATITLLDDDAERPQMTAARVSAGDAESVRVSVEYDEPVDCVESPDQQPMLVHTESVDPRSQRPELIGLESCDGDNTVVLVYDAYALARGDVASLRVPGKGIHTRTFVVDQDGLSTVGDDRIAVDTSASPLPPPFISLPDATVMEPKAGEECLDLRIVLEGPWRDTWLWVDYRTIEGTATAPDDFEAHASFVHGSTSFYGPDNPDGFPEHDRRLPVCLARDSMPESTETYQVMIRTNRGTVVDGAATVTILDDDLPRLELAGPAAPIVAGDRAEISGHLTNSTGRAGFASQAVSVQRYSTASSAWREVGRTTTDSRGGFSMEVGPRYSARYRARYEGHAHLAQVLTKPVRVQVRPVVSAAFSRPEVHAGHLTALVGRTTPTHPGYDVAVQRRGSDGWRTVDTVRTDEDGRYRWRTTPTQPGVMTYRAVLPGHDDHAAGLSPVTNLSVAGP